MLFLTISLVVLAITHAKYKGDEILPRIWNGTRANIRDYPFYGELYYHGKCDCGAAILSPRWLATAGHCYDDDYLKEKRTVWVGAEDKKDATFYTVDYMIQHPDFHGIDLQHLGFGVNDISLIRVKTPLVLSDKVKPIQLPKHNYEVNVLHSFAGRGEDETGKEPKYLMQMTTRTHDMNEFFQLFNETEELEKAKPIITKSLIYVQRDGNLPSICFGDSGSGLVRNGTLVGLASALANFEGSCADPKGVLFTNVFPYVDWIKSVTGIP